jgi:hypothetical protein
MPGLTHDQLMTSIELYGRQVIPRVREPLTPPLSAGTRAISV